MHWISSLMNVFLYSDQEVSQRDILLDNSNMCF